SNSRRSMRSGFGDCTRGSGKPIRAAFLRPGIRGLTATTLAQLCRCPTHRISPLGETLMPKYIIEREIPNAAALSPAELKAISQKSCGVLQKLGPSIQWVQSYVTEDKITCVYIAPNADIIREHARLGGFPADRVLEVATIIDPTTAESNELAGSVGIS